MKRLDLRTLRLDRNLVGEAKPVTSSPVKVAAPMKDEYFLVINPSRDVNLSENLAVIDAVPVSTIDGTVTVPIDVSGFETVHIHIVVT